MGSATGGFKPLGLPFLFAAVPLLYAAHATGSRVLGLAGAVAGVLHLTLCNALYLMALRRLGLALRGRAAVPPLLGVLASAVLAAAAAMGAGYVQGLAALAAASAGGHYVRVRVISGMQRRGGRCIEALQQQGLTLR